MRRGLTTLEVAILSAIVMVAAALLGSIFLRAPNRPATQPTVAIYSVSVVGPQYYGTTLLSAAQQCSQIALKMYEEGLLSAKRPIEVGDPNSKYAYVMVVRVLQPGLVKGIKISEFAGNQLVKVVEKSFALPIGRYLVCVYSNKYYLDVKLEFLGANNLCVKCEAR